MYYQEYKDNYLYDELLSDGENVRLENVQVQIMFTVLSMILFLRPIPLSLRLMILIQVRLLSRLILQAISIPTNLKPVALSSLKTSKKFCAEKILFFRH